MGGVLGLESSSGVAVVGSTSPLPGEGDKPLVDAGSRGLAVGRDRGEGG